MKKFKGMKSLALMAILVLPSTVWAGIQVELPQNNCLTWTLVGTKAGLLNSQSSLKQGKLLAASSLLNATPQNTPARLGFYLGPAANPPQSIVGQDYRQNLVEKVKYGLYLVSTF